MMNSVWAECEEISTSLVSEYVCTLAQYVDEPRS